MQVDFSWFSLYSGNNVREFAFSVMQLNFNTICKPASIFTNQQRPSLTIALTYTQMYFNCIQLLVSIIF